MKRLHSTLLAMLLVFGLAAAPLPIVTADAAAPPTLELALDAMPLAAATVETPAIVDEPAAPELPPVSGDPRVWFETPLNLAAVLAIVVSFLKMNVLKDLSGWRTIAVSAAAAVVLTFYGRVTGWHDRSFTDSLTFAVTAFVYASGGWAAITQLLGALGKVIATLLSGKSRAAT